MLRALLRLLGGRTRRSLVKGLLVGLARRRMLVPAAVSTLAFLVTRRLLPRLRLR